MAIHASSSLLNEFTQWADEKRDAFLQEFPIESFIPESLVETPVSLKDSVLGDFKRHCFTLVVHSVHTLQTFAQIIATLVFVPFSLVAEAYRLASGEIDLASCLSYVVTIPVRLIVTLFKAALGILKTIDNVVIAISRSAGFLVWCSGEWLVNTLSGTFDTILSLAAYIPILQDWDISRFLKSRFLKSVDSYIDQTVSGSRVCSKIFSVQTSSHKEASAIATRATR